MLQLDQWLGRDRIIDGPGFNRWLLPPAALAIHLCIGGMACRRAAVALGYLDPGDEGNTVVRHGLTLVQLASFELSSTPSLALLT